MFHSTRLFRSVMLIAISWLFGLAAANAQDWPTYGGPYGGSRYSTADQINRDNVDQLEIAWTYRTGHLERHKQLQWAVGFQATPILLPDEAGGHLVTCTPFNRVVALDPVTGEERWYFDPEISPIPVAGRFNCRGVTQWKDKNKQPEATCAYRIFLATNDRRLMAIDARDGALCTDFGEGGIVDVTPIIEQLPPTNQIRSMQLMSPVAVVNDVLVIGGTANKFRDVSSNNGALRGFDTRTGQHLWTFDTLIRDPNDPESTSYDVGGANVWITMSVDNERDLLFAPTASASPNYYGGLRPGDNRHASSVLAIRGSTGELVWAQQLLHHDVWDWDPPTHPILVDITRDGQKIPVVVQLTKIGVVFIFHRETGEPFFEIEEREVPKGTIPGDELSPTQPFPVKPPPLVRHGLSVDDAWGFTLYDRNECRKLIESMDHGPIYTPPSTRGTIMSPQVGGGSNWAGGAFDPERNILVTPVSQFASFIRLVPNDEIDPELAKIPTAGNPNGPPGYTKGSPYGLVQGTLLSPFGVPCTKPPWAMVVGVDLAKGEILWKSPLGIIDKLASEQGMPALPLRLGTPFAGGGIATAGGLFFIGGTADERFRAYDIETGDLLWEIKSFTSANATPMTYVVDGRQYVVVSTGGHAWMYPQNKQDYVVAYALPEN
ncbi:MAG: pyrroloquinoline quinone-dependent dehydrogenase [Alphaproteobacteria bacterium]|nr:MAG: pyrroloquinoline quinone-dependent dehydrogenase [Alphaproteobacteria bacterium]